MSIEVEVKACADGCGVCVRVGNQTWCLPEETARELFQKLLRHLADLPCKLQ